MKKIIIIISLTLLAIPAICHSYDEKKAMDNLAYDYASCAAFYYLSTDGVIVNKNENDDKRIQQYLELSKYSYRMSVELSSKALTMARIELVSLSFKRKMNEDWLNFSLVLDRYASLCEKLMKEPKDRLDYWLKK